MKIKIGDTIYDSEDQPVMVILTDKDRRNIAKMHPKCTKYCAFPEDTSAIEVHRFMRTESTNV